jgi:uncharacterized protein
VLVLLARKTSTRTGMNYNFEWDKDKAEGNMVKHRVRFEEASTVFCDSQMMTLFDREHSQIEDRWITLGLSSIGRLLLVCHTFREDDKDATTIRIFSARKASTKENNQYSDG